MCVHGTCRDYSSTQVGGYLVLIHIQVAPSSDWKSHWRPSHAGHVLPCTSAVPAAQHGGFATSH